MSIKIATAVVIMIAGTTLHAAAFDGHDGDNNPIPGSAFSIRSVPDSYFASQVRHGNGITRNPASSPRPTGVQVGETKADQPNAVYWRSRYLGTDPDPHVRLRMLREAIGG